MILDGIQPVSDTFTPLLVGCMKGGRMQDAFYFYEEMKCMGYIPDVCLSKPWPENLNRRTFQIVFAWKLLFFRT
jgi:pentatricopeptide repeat protein